MWRFALSFTLSALAFEDPQFEDAEALQLLQVAATKHQHNKTAGFSRGNGYCALAGDTHTNGVFYGPVPDPMQFGLYRFADSKDGRFKAQLFQCNSQQKAGVGWINAMAFDIDGTQIQVLPPVPDPSKYEALQKDGPVYVRANGIEYSSDQFPLTIPGTNIEFRAHKTYSFHIVTDGFDSSIVMWNNGDSAYVDADLKLDADNYPDPDENSFCIKGTAATPLANAEDADWSASLFSVADHERICAYCNYYTKFRADNAGIDMKTLDYLKCHQPPPAPPLPPAKVECEKNGCSWVHAQQLCSSLKGDDVLYQDCMFDFCLDCEDAAAAHLVADEEEEHPAPICVAGAPECAPAEVCTEAVKMNTLTVSHNNLGGVGPDAGAEEIRYSNAAVVNGRKVDLVLSTDGVFKTSKASKNGHSGAFGVLNVKCGTSVTVTMKMVDSENGQPVVLDTVALTWFDLDEGKKGSGRATVGACGSTGAIVSQNTELTVERQGDCSTSTSSVAGTGKDNPTSPHNLNSLQIARAVTLPFKAVSEITSTLSLAKGHKGRNFLFAIEPSVACGLPSR